MAKKFIIRLLIFLFLFACFNFALDRINKKMYNAISYLKDKQFLEYKGRLKYLLLGDSYIQCGVDPTIFKNSFNISSAQETYAFTYYKLRNIVEKIGRKPENIIIQDDPSSFSSMRTEKGANDLYWYKIADYSEMAKLSGNNKYYFRWFRGKFFSYVGKYQSIQKKYTKKARFEESDVTNVVLGYKPWLLDFSTFSERQQQMQLLDRTHTYFGKHSYLDSYQLFCFERILQYALMNHIGVYIIRVPATDAYLKEVSKYFNIDSVNLKIENIAKRYPNYKGMLDYQNQFRDHPDYFHNPDHLNDHGAKALSELLQARLN